ncbi:MAG TPA: EamA family transporter [Ruminococcus sp.]|nr:EamA family transporter [Ruminococcus sp.]
MMKSKLSKTWIICLLASFSCFLWGSAFPFIKIGYKILDIKSDDYISQILFAGIRFTAAGIITVIFGSLANKKLLVPDKKSIPAVMKLSLFQTILQYMFFYIGLANTTGIKASVINASGVFLCIFITGFVFRLEKISVYDIVGSLIGFAGVILININGLDMHISLIGDGFIFLCSASYAMSSVCMKKYSAKFNPVMLSGYQFIFGGIVMTLAGIIFGGHIDKISAEGILVTLYLAFVSGAAYSVWSLLLKNNPVSKVAIFGFFNPLFGVMLSGLLLDESEDFGIKGIISLILVCTGIIIVNKRKKVRSS